MIQFSNPLLLAGLAAMVVPMVLHLLSRSRFRSINWGAMIFLPGGDGRRRQASRLRQWLLLAMRCGILGTLATALALPRLRLGHDNGPTLAILILDHSASMGVMENERSRMDRAREAALNLLATLRPGDQAALIDATSPQIPRITSDLQVLGQEILSTDAGDERADFAAALSRALVLRREQTGIKSRIYIISDRQANNWTDVSAAFMARWKKEASPPITWIPVGGRRGENVAIDSVRLLDAPAIAGLPAEIAVQVHNYGTSARGPIHLNLSDDSHRLAGSDLTLEPREERTVVLPVHFVQAGEVRLTASIDTADLASDNARTYVLEVSKRLPVLIITGEQASGRFRRQADILQLALAPFSSSTTGPAADNRNPFVVRVVDAEQWNPQWFDGQRVVILADAPALSADQLRTLEQFTYIGGGLIIAPGNLVRADDFNQTLYRNATGISPASLSPPTSSDAAPTSILGIDLSHPIFQFLKGSPDPIPQATIARYFPANPHGGDVRVLASYATGEPFLVEGTFGHGHVLLVTTPLDADWSNLPLSNFYLPFVQSCVKYLCAVQMSRRDLQRGEMIAGSFDGNADARSVRVMLPDGRVDECEVSPLGDRLEFRYGPVSAAGEYIVRAASPGGELRQSFILAAPAEESDLTPLGAEEIRHLQDDLGVNVISPDKESLPSAGGGEEISLWLGGIIVVLVLASGEMVLAGLWGRGLAK